MRITTVKHFQYKGYQCKIKNIDSADEYFMTYYLKLKDVSNRKEWLCGYVELPRGHKYYGCKDRDFEFLDLVAHGGITFASFDDDAKYYIGIDCNHACDNDKTNTIEFVEENLKEIIDELNIMITMKEGIKDETRKEQ
jgi:hypothetical protein